MKTGSLSRILYSTILMGNFDVFDGLLLDNQDIATLSKFLKVLQVHEKRY